MKKLVIPAKEIKIGDFLGEAERPPVNLIMSSELSRSVGNFCLEITSLPVTRGSVKGSPNWTQRFKLEDLVTVYRREEY